MTTVRRFDYLDALRGYAILSVIVVHASQYFGTDSSPAAAQFLSQGARGVQLFFVVKVVAHCNNPDPPLSHLRREHALF